MKAVRAHEREITAYALERLAAVDGLTIFGPRDADERGGLVSFALEGVHPHDIAEICNRDAVAIRAGHHCAQPLMRVPGRAGHRPRVVLRLQHQGRGRPAGRPRS